jgi:two-component system, response regulator
VNNAEVELLMVEDNADDVALALRALKKNHLINRIRVVNDGVEALEYIFGANDGPCLCTPKVILLDLHLPKVSGLEVLRKLKADERTKAIPIVVLTSSREDQDITECYKLGVNSYIVKPVDFDNFTHAVSELGLYWVLLNTPPT